MKVRQIQIAGFRGFNDLVVDHFRPGLNFVLFPDEDSAQEFFDQTINAFHPIDWSNCDARVEVQNGIDSVILNGRNRNGTLRLVDRSNKSRPVPAISAQLSAFTKESFHTVFTDALNGDEFQNNCCSIGFDRFLSSSESNNAIEPNRIRKTISVDQTIEQIENIQESLEALQSQRNSNSARNEYIQLLRDQQQTESNRSRVLERIAKLTAEREPLELAADLAQYHSRLNELEVDVGHYDQIENLEETKVHIANLDRQMQKCRSKIRKAKANLDASTTDHQSRPSSLLKKCLEGRAEAIDLEKRIRRVQDELESASLDQRQTSCPKTSTRAILEELLPSAKHLSETKRRISEIRASNRFDLPTRLDSKIADENQDSETIAQLRARIDTLQDACADLLAPQAISNSSLSMIAFLFVLGAILVLCALFWSLGAWMWPSLLFGVGSICAAVFLLFVSQRAPIQQVQQHRRQIREMFEEISRLQNNNDAPLFRPIDVFSLDAELSLTRKEYARAKRDWRAALQRLQLPDHLSPKQLLQQFKQKPVPQSGSTGPNLASPKHNELQQLSSQLEGWKSKCYRVLNVTQHGLSVDELIARLELLNVDTQDTRRGNSAGSMVRLLEEQQAQLALLKKQRKKRIRQAGYATIEELSQHIQKLQDDSSLDEERDRLQSVIAERTSQSKFGLAAKSHLAESSHQEILERLQKIDTDLMCKREELAAIEAQLPELKRQYCDLIHQDRNYDGKTQVQINQLRRQQIFDNLLIQLLLQKTIDPDKKVTESFHPWLEVATRYLQIASRRTDLSIGYSHQKNLFYVRKGRYRKSWEALNKKQLQQTAISLQLALIEFFRNENCDHPLFLKGRWFQWNEQDASAMVSLVRELASREHQILLFSSEQWLADLFSDHGLPILKVQLKKETLPVSPVEENLTLDRMAPRNPDSPENPNSIDMLQQARGER